MTVSLTNTTDRPLEASVSLLLTNFVGTDGLASDLKDNVTERAQVGGWSGMRFAKNRPPQTARDGTMAMVPGSLQSGVFRVVWVDRQGTIQPVDIAPALYHEMRLSPDGGRIAMLRGSSGFGDVWIYDIRADTSTRLTFTGNAAAQHARRVPLAENSGSHQNLTKRPVTIAAGGAFAGSATRRTENIGVTRVGGPLPAINHYACSISSCPDRVPFPFLDGPWSPVPAARRDDPE